MPKISMLIPEDVLAEIDAQAGGNRTSFMVAAAIERARTLKRDQIDREIATTLTANATENAAAYRDWEPTLADGLE
jgi:uncharacterized protein (DUF1778 family)